MKNIKNVGLVPTMDYTLTPEDEGVYKKKVPIYDFIAKVNETNPSKEVIEFILDSLEPNIYYYYNVRLDIVSPFFDEFNKNFYENEIREALSKTSLSKEYIENTISNLENYVNSKK